MDSFKSLINATGYLPKKEDRKESVYTGCLSFKVTDALNILQDPGKSVVLQPRAGPLWAPCASCFLTSDPAGLGGGGSRAPGQDRALCFLTYSPHTQFWLRAQLAGPAWSVFC